MMGSVGGSGVWRPPALRFGYLDRKRIAMSGEPAVWSAEYDLDRWVTVVSTLGAYGRDSSSQPSDSCPPSSVTLRWSSAPSLCHSMASGAWGLEVMIYDLAIGDLSLVSSPGFWYLEVLTRVSLCRWILCVPNGVGLLRGGIVGKVFAMLVAI